MSLGAIAVTSAKPTLGSMERHTVAGEVAATHFSGVGAGPQPLNLLERANAGLHAHVLAHATALVPDRNALVLDLGCGTGAFLAQLRLIGYRHLVGLDIAPPPSLEGVRLNAIDLDACHTGLASGSVRLVTAIEMLEHVENLGGLLAELSRILAPTGKVLVTTPNVHSLEARLRWLLLGQLKQFDTLGDPTHVTPIFRFPFERLAARHGLRVVRCWGFPEDGSSPTSRRLLRVLAGVARLAGLDGDPAGDQLCMVLEPAARGAGLLAGPEAKRQQVTAHYGSG
jgi:2-polyprenyl-3-methyl-5-hydroxy-6-metoxy-1,4-benzoquinol methylase